MKYGIDLFYGFSVLFAQTFLAFLVNRVKRFDELLDLFGELKAHGVTILFSTHITSDLEKCADNIVYISKGEIRAFRPREDFMRENGRPGETLEEIFLRLEKEARA